MNNNYFVAVNYHYIGSEKKFEKGIYPVSPERLAKQIDLLKEDFELIGEKKLLEFLDGKRKFNNKPGCILTFDDGLKCQYKNALPVLKRKKAPAIFFVNSHPLVSDKVCLNHKIHYLLAKVPSEKLLDKVELFYKSETGHDLKINEQICKKAIEKGAYDDEQTAVFKYLVNNHLSFKIAGKIISDTFVDIFGDEKKFLQKLYFNRKELKAIAGQYLQFSLGLHSADHIDIPTTDRKEVEKDILENYDFLKNEIKAKNVCGFSYPFGVISENDLENKLRKIMQRINLRYAFTIFKGRNDLTSNKFLLSRFDTNDAPGGKKPLAKM